MCSILSGKLPQEHGVRLFYQLAPKGLELIPDLLPDDCQTAAFVSNVVLTDEALEIAPHFDHYDDFVGERESRRGPYRTPDDWPVSFEPRGQREIPTDCFGSICILRN